MTSSEKMTQKIRKILAKIRSKQKAIGGCVFSLGLGGIISTLILQSLIPAIPALRQDIASAVCSSSVSVDPIMACIILISTFALLLSPAIISGNKQWGRKVTGLLVLLFVGSLLLSMTLAADWSVVPFEIFSWIFCAYLVWLLIGIFNALHHWVTLKDDSKKYDIAKLTFIWAILVFILGKVL